MGWRQLGSFGSNWSGCISAKGRGQLMVWDVNYFFVRLKFALKLLRRPQTPEPFNIGGQGGLDTALLLVVAVVVG